MKNLLCNSISHFLVVKSENLSAAYKDKRESSTKRHSQ